MNGGEKMKKHSYLYVLMLLLSFMSVKSESNDDILLIVNYNFAYYDSIEFLREIYSPYFPHIVFCGPKKDSRVEYIDHQKGYFGYKSISHVMKKYPDFAGYFYINDDSVINCWNLRRLDKTKIWFRKMSINTVGSHLLKSTWIWWRTKWGLSALNKAQHSLPEMYKEALYKNMGKNKAAGAASDLVYFPARLKDDVIFLADHYAKYSLFLEIAIPMICCTLSSYEDIEILRGLYLWGNDRKNLFKKYSRELDFIHPIKLSKQENREFVCKQYVCSN